MSRNPKERNGEKIGGGFFIFRRGKRTGRVGVRYNTIPFEHPDFESAQAEARRLANKNPGETFEIFGTTGFKIQKPNSDDRIGEDKMDEYFEIQLYRAVNGVNQAVFYILPALGHHPDEFPLFLDAFYVKESASAVSDTISILTLSGGDNRKRFEDKNNWMLTLPGHLYTDDQHDSTNLIEWIFEIPEKWKVDVKALVEGRKSDVSEDYVDQICSVFPKLREKIREIFK